MPLTSSQLAALARTTRLSSTLSLLCSLFIVLTYAFLPSVRRPTTRLIFYATWGNVLTNVATLGSLSPIPHAGNEGVACVLQGLVIQWFMLADPVWVFCMAINVFLVFRGRGVDRIPRLEMWYCLVAYGLPALAPLAYLIHDRVAVERVIGPAIASLPLCMSTTLTIQLWCWVRKEFDWMRIAFFYGPMWILAIATMSIHMWVGMKIYKVKMELRRCLKASQQPLHPTNAHKDPFIDQVTVTTNISHNTLVNEPSSPTPNTPTTPPRPRRILFPHNPSSPLRPTQLLGTYTATAHAAPLASGDFATLPQPCTNVFRPVEHLAHTRRRSESREAYAYFKSALLLLVALLVVWGPSSANRLVQLTGDDGRGHFALNLVSAAVLPSQGFWNAVIYAHAVSARLLFGRVR